MDDSMNPKELAEQLERLHSTASDPLSKQALAIAIGLANRESEADNLTKQAWPVLRGVIINTIQEEGSLLMTAKGGGLRFEQETFLGRMTFVHSADGELTIDNCLCRAADGSLVDMGDPEFADHSPAYVRAAIERITQEMKAKKVD